MKLRYKGKAHDLKKVRMNRSSRNNSLLPTFIPKTYIILFETSLIHDILGEKKKPDLCAICKVQMHHSLTLLK